MALVPRSTGGRAIASIWLLMCSGLLVFAWLQRDIHDMPVAFTWLMIFLTIPIGFPVAMAIGLATSAISKALGIAYDPFWDLVPSWIAFTFAGYLQWFVFVPFVWSKLRGRERAI
jgi:hypothetical protein